MKKRILIVDDDRDLCTLLSRYLERNGYEVDVAYSGKSGITKFKQGNFDMVVCDYRLGDKEGKEVLEEIKAHDPEAIVLIITGYSDIKVAVDIIKLGAYDYITKPLIPKEVLNVLNKALSNFFLSEPDETNTKEAEKKNHKNYNSDNEFLVAQGKAAKELYRQGEIRAKKGYSSILSCSKSTRKRDFSTTIT